MSLFNKGGSMKYETYKAFVVQAFDNETPEGMLEGLTVLTLVTESEKQAIKIAKRIIKRKDYRVSQVIENFIRTEFKEKK